MNITVGARSSHLSQAQVAEVFREISIHHVGTHFQPMWVMTEGDRDTRTPLWKVNKTDFFTKEIDRKLLLGECRIAIHSAKDLPEPLPAGLSIIALTKGVDSRDSFVMPSGVSVTTLPLKAKIGISSKRREETVYNIRPDFSPVDVRGSIDARLAQMDENIVAALIIAEAAIIRLKLTHLNRLLLSYTTDPLQGRLAIMAQKHDYEMHSFFAPIDARNNL